MRVGPLILAWLLPLKEEVRRDNHAANSTSKLLRMQECRICRQHVSLGRQRSGYAAIAEHVAIAKRIVWMIEDVKYLRLYLKILGLSNVKVPAEGNVPGVETR